VSASLVIALLIALSEAALFLIWQARKDKAAKRRQIVDVRHKKDEGESSGNKAEDPLEYKATSTTLLSTPGQTRLVHLKKTSRNTIH
jgi:hypothetical protein